MPKIKKYKTLREVDKIVLSKNSKEIFDRRYAIRDENGTPSETVEEGFYRVANHVANGEKTKKLRDEYTKNYYNLMGDMRFVPNAPAWSGSKTKLGQLAACFVLPIKDDMGSNRGGIFDTLKNAALIQQTGGGNGFSFSELRPKGDRVKASNGIASGPVSFLEAYDTAFGQIAQGGARRGANMAVLEVSHPDIRDFIKCKSEEGTISNFNISVGITDKFMEAVKTDSDFDLINPRNGEVWETINAKELFDEIVNYAHKNGEPGILFLDAANRENPVPNQYTLAATNPCGEQWLGPYENCCLGHVNINASVKDGEMDWDHLRESIELGTRFLDDVVTQNAYVPAVPELKKAAHKNRRIGLGYLGLADAMYQLGIRYGSEKSLEYAAQITEFVRYHSMLTSIDLAKEKGPFPGIEGSIYDPKDLKWEIPTPLKEYKLDFNRPKLYWKKVERELKKQGIRNSTQLTVAPTGSTATVFGVEGYGCEPVFALAYYRNVYQAAGGDENLQLTYVSPSFQSALDNADLSDEQKKEIIEQVIENGSVQDVEGVPEDIKNTFVVSADIKADEHVMIQASIQKFVDNSISKTCNFPAGATKDDVKEAYMKSWNLGCKGLTVYVTGSRSEVVLETKATKDSKATADADLNDNPESTVEENVELMVDVVTKKPRPQVVVGRTHEISTPFGEAFVTVNRNGPTDIKPFEVFVLLGRSGSDVAAMSEALGRLISGWLRSSAHPNKSLEEIAHQLKGIGGSSSYGFGSNRVSSIPDAVAKVLFNELELSKKLNDNEARLLENTFEFDQQELFNKESEAKDDSSDIENTKEEAHANKNESEVFRNASVCPDCGNMTLVEQEGCIKCVTCAYSRC